MIINHQHQFCFFAIPRTASKAISKVLLEELDSESRLKMHVSYAEFKQTASRKEKRYFSFASIRHPMDSVVSAYFKKKNDHNGRFSRGTFKKTGIPIGERAMKEYQFIQSNNASFQDYFKVFYTTPYAVPRHEATIEAMDAIIRYEYLNEDFAKVMAQLNLPTYPIPFFNKTEGKTANFMDFYTPDILPQAEKVFERILTKWGYSI